MKETESNIEGFLTKNIQKMNGLCLKFSTLFFSGMPDRVILLPGGKVVFAEIKRPDKNTTELQTKRKIQLEQLGFQSVILKSTEDVLNFVKRLG